MRFSNAIHVFLKQNEKSIDWFFSRIIDYTHYIRVTNRVGTRLPAIDDLLVRFN